MAVHRFLLPAWVGALLVLAASRPSPAANLNVIQRENRQPGTTAWQLTNPAEERQIEGYASLTSVPIGGDIKLFVNTQDRTYSMTIFRMGWYGGTGGRKVQGPQNFTGVRQVTPTVDPSVDVIDCQWTNPVTIHVPYSWVSGIFLAKLHGNQSGKESYVIFTVRDARRADLVFQQSVITYQAYNPWPGFTASAGYNGQSLYTFETAGLAQVKAISFNRPYGLADRAFGSPSNLYSQTVNGYYGIGAGDFLHNIASAAMDFGVVRWLEHEGYDVTYVTDVDTHEDVARLLRARGYLNVGHDEYVTREMKAHILQARDQGIGLGFFAANSLYWAVKLLPDSRGVSNRTISLFSHCADPTTGVCASDAECASDADCEAGEHCAVKVCDYNRTLDANGERESEQAIIGGLWDPGAAIAGGGDIIVTDDAVLDHWVFANTGLQIGDVIPGVVGPEYNTTLLTAGPNEVPYPVPDGLEILLHTQVPNFGAGNPGFPLPPDFDGKDFNGWYESIAGSPRHCGNDLSQECTSSDDCCADDVCRAFPPSCEQLSTQHCGNDFSRECSLEHVVHDCCLDRACAFAGPTCVDSHCGNDPMRACTPETVVDDCCTDAACAAAPPSCATPCDKSPISPLLIVPLDGFCGNPFPYWPGLRFDWTMTAYQAASGAWVFNAATNEWAWGLDDYFTGLKTPDGANNGPPLRIRCGYPWFHPGLVSCRHPAIEQITRNVLNRFITGH